MKLRPSPVTHLRLSAIAGTLLPLVLPSAAIAAEPSLPRMVVGEIAATKESSQLSVRLIVLNTDAEAGMVTLPKQVPARLLVDGSAEEVTLECDTPFDEISIPPGGFGSMVCTLALPTELAADAELFLALGEDGTASPQFVLDLPEGPAERLALADEPASLPSAPEAVKPITADDPIQASQMPSAKADSGNAFINNLSAYGPIYAAYGPGTNSEARIQVSFKYQLFGEAGAVGGDNPALNGIHFGYTQRMFWDLGAESSPFRNIDFMPELFYLMPATDIGDGLTLGGQIGLRHESNGRSDPDSRSANTLYIQPVMSMETGDYTFAFGPRLFAYVGDLEDNPDIAHFRGSTGLFAEIGQDDGLRLTTNTRFNFSSGKGAIDAELSYPLDRIVDTSLNLYLFGQGFVGYGENLLDYNRKMSRLRVGLSIVR